MALEDFINVAGTVAGAIPGGKLPAAILGGLGSIFGLGNKQKKLSEAEKMNQQVLQMQLQQMKTQLALQQFATPYWQNELTQLGQRGPYAPAGAYDPYSPLANEAATMGYRDDTAQNLQREMSAIDYYLKPQGGVRSSAQEYARARAIRDANSDNAAFQRNLRIQGGIERYNNSRRESDERFRRMQSLMSSPPMYGGYNNGAYAQNQQMAQQGYDQNLASLAGAVQAIGAAGGFKNRGPRGGMTGPDAGNATLAPMNQTTPTAPWLAPANQQNTWLETRLQRYL